MSKRNCIVIIFFLMVSASCKSDKTVIPVDTMMHIVWDMMKADDYIVLKHDTMSTIKDQSLNLYTNIFKCHKISKEQFYYSYTHYLSHPDQCKKLFDSVKAFAKRSVEVEQKLYDEEEKQKIKALQLRSWSFINSKPSTDIFHYSYMMPFNVYNVR